jgi:hypothetical protein
MRCHFLPASDLEIDYHEPGSRQLAFQTGKVAGIGLVDQAQRQLPKSRVVPHHNQIFDLLRVFADDLEESFRGGVINTASDRQIMFLLNTNRARFHVSCVRLAVEAIA